MENLVFSKGGVTSVTPFLVLFANLSDALLPALGAAADVLPGLLALMRGLLLWSGGFPGKQKTAYLLCRVTGQGGQYLVSASPEGGKAAVFQRTGGKRLFT